MMSAAVQCSLMIMMEVDMNYTEAATAFPHQCTVIYKCSQTKTSCGR